MHNTQSNGGGGVADGEIPRFAAAGGRMTRARPVTARGHLVTT